MKRAFKIAADEPGEALAVSLARLDCLVNLERADRSSGAPAADAIRRVDLEPARDLLRRLDNPDTDLRVIHVSGTKGKGSVCALIAAALDAAGLRAGLYTSPHVEHVTERIMIGAAPVQDDLLAKHLHRALDARDAACAEGSVGRDATWFDVFTCAAFSVFAEQGIDWAVVEVGLGGRLDSTNVLAGEVCLVTNIDLEHTAVLGDTRAAIATEKAGIFKSGCAALTGVAMDDTDAAPPLREAAQAVGATLVHVEQSGRLTDRNAALALAALDALGSRGVRARDGRALGGWLLSSALRAESQLPGRLEQREMRGVHVVLDGAHVPSSLAAVLDELQDVPGLSRPPQVVFGAGLDKDACGLLKLMLGRVDRVQCTSAGTGPYQGTRELTEYAVGVGLDAVGTPEPEEALLEALSRAQPNGWVLVTGSLHLVGAVRGLLPEAPSTTHVDHRLRPHSHRRLPDQGAD